MLNVIPGKEKQRPNPTADQINLVCLITTPHFASWPQD